MQLKSPKRNFVIVGSIVNSTTIEETVIHLWYSSLDLPRMSYSIFKTTMYISTIMTGVKATNIALK